MKILLLVVISAFVLAFSGRSVTAAPTTRPAPPNIVYILADDLGYADVGFMGCKDIHTPHVDALSKDAMVMTSFYVQPVCSPTRASLLTGRYVCHTGVYRTVDLDTNWGLPLDERTLAQALHERGYETAIVGKWHLGKSTEGYQPTHRGFDIQYGNWYGMIDYFTHMRNGVLDWHRDDQLSHDPGYSTFLDAKEACRIIKEKKADQPLFLYLAFNAPHQPLQAPPEYLSQYTALKGKRAKYAAVVTALDDSIQTVIDALKEKGMLDNTLIIFTSDNGGAQPGIISNNGPLRAGKGTIYEGGLRVPAFALWPGHIHAGRTDEAVHVVDWYPTLVKLAGGSLEQKLPLDGVDMWDTIAHGAKTPHDALLLCGGGPQRCAIRMGDWKLLLSANARDTEEAKEDEPASGDLQLYNLATDLGETKDLFKENPDKAKELKARLDEWMKGFVPCGGDAPGVDQHPKRKNGKPA